MSQKRSCCAALSSPAPGPRADATCTFGARKSVLTPSGMSRGAEDALYLFFAPTKTSRAIGKEFAGRIFTREQDRTRSRRWPSATRSPKRSLTRAPPT